MYIDLSQQNIQWFFLNIEKAFYLAKRIKRLKLDILYPTFTIRHLRLLNH
jgi:hypothetical protein